VVQQVAERPGAAEEGGGKGREKMGKARERQDTAQRGDQTVLKKGDGRQDGEVVQQVADRPGAAEGGGENRGGRGEGDSTVRAGPESDYQGHTLLTSAGVGRFSKEKGKKRERMSRSIFFSSTARSHLVRTQVGGRGQAHEEALQPREDEHRGRVVQTHLVEPAPAATRQ